MTTEITFLGHSAVEVTSGDTSVLIDPFISGNPNATHKPGDFNPNAVLITHGHADHVGDAVYISKENNCPIIAIFELANHLGNLGAPKPMGMGCGGSAEFDFGTVKFVPALHSSSYEGLYMGQACGLVYTTKEGAKIYHAGDTALFSDMKLIGRLGIDVAILPIGSHFTMDPADAADAVEILEPQYVIPVHYNTFPPIEQDAEAFKKDVEGRTSSQVVVMNPGDTHQF
jgi:L-ascorbate metabolism protein UlaG (beta-lactamase superfamily)